ncbi:hypothetical protein BDV37DRAFT_248028 [Aspergillus pseudonomiae]|uniref:Uncharacterized protein n=1 Tax=Aspergillus pseudonomiae TaxID=1506151 RepID=A0A5N7DCY2_9EURO|nr:uncharacterized protein BDV37DRAFT_248028 [Aspergillus pseudonomiae]KAE8404262.1 hypothetical protein BDV37DRAFT_248028 [Aspergillus pseudonomiae]
MASRRPSSGAIWEHHRVLLGALEYHFIKFVLLHSAPFVAIGYADQRALTTSNYPGGVWMELPLNMPWGA